jgi:DNA-binding transcriptional ArsR family regulator
MITPDEWDGLSLLIEEWWPGEFTDATATAWRMALDDFGAERALAGLKACLARGGRFRPSVAEIVGEIRCDPSRPTFSEALTLIYGRGGVLRARTGVRKGSWEAGERDRLNDEAVWDRAAELPPLIGAFVRMQGLDRLRRLDLDDPEYGGARRKQLADEWEAFVEAHENRDVAALVAGRRGELGRFDPLRVLDGPRLLERRAS